MLSLKREYDVICVSLNKKKITVPLEIFNSILDVTNFDYRNLNLHRKIILEDSIYKKAIVITLENETITVSSDIFDMFCTLSLSTLKISNFNEYIIEE